MKYLKDFSSMLLHPFYYQKHLRDQRLGVGLDWDKAHVPFTLSEAVLVSWPFRLIEAFYSLMGIALSLYFFKNILPDYGEFRDFLGQLRFHQSNMSIIMILTGVIFYPVKFYIAAKLWLIMIRFIDQLFGKNTDELTQENVVSCAFASNLCYVIPLFGDFLSGISFLINLYAGLRENMKYSVAQSMVVLIAPIFVIFLILLLIVIDLLLILSLSFSSL